MKVPENVRKHTQLIKSAQIKLDMEVQKFKKEKTDELLPCLNSYKAMVNSIPNHYAGEFIKGRLNKNKELDMLRIVQTKVLYKTTNDWTTQNMIRMVQYEK